MVTPAEHIAVCVHPRSYGNAAVCEMPGEMCCWREELLVKAGVFYKRLDRSSGQLCSVTDTPTELPSSGKHPELEREIIFHSVCIVSGKNLWAE